MRPRVLMLNYEFPPLGGGSGNACYHLLREFARLSDVRIDLVTSGWGATVQRETFAETVEIVRLPVGKRMAHLWTAREIGIWSLTALRLSYKLARQNDYDLCHSWSGWPSGVLAYLLRGRMPYLLALRGSDVPGYSARLATLDRFVFRRLCPILWRRAAVVTSVSRNLRDLARETCDDVEIEVIRNGVDSQTFTPMPGSAPFTILFVGRLVSRKGVIHLLEAFKGLRRDHPGCHVVIAGDGPERGRLEEYCRRHGLEDSVEFLGVVAREGLPEIYRSADVFVMPALEEAMPNAMLEAMAAGLPAVVTDTGSSELIHGNGMVVGRGDSEQLREALERYVRFPSLARRHGSASRRLAQTITWEEKARAYLALYERICGHGAHVRAARATDSRGVS